MSFAAIIAIVFACLVGIAILVALIRAIATPRAAPAAPPLPESALEEAAGVEEELSALVRRATVSYYDRDAEDDSAFIAFKKDLELLFPKVHAKLRREEIGDRALLFTWEGSDKNLAPAILCAHFDVVPAEDALLWKHGPFSGDIAEGCVWGRGTQDIKLMLVSSLHAAERLLGEGFMPGRSIYFAFGGDEEVDGLRGARLVGEVLASRGVRASFLLDEGGPVADGMLSFADRPLALVGIAEKGYIDVAIEAAGTGGHASMPPRRTATGNLARAIVAIEASPPHARLGYTVRSFLDKLSPYSPFPIRILFRNLWLFGPLVKAVFGASHATNAMIRTTYAPTLLQGSASENVLADLAWANVNVRILPGEVSGETLARLARLARPFGATAKAAHPGAEKEPLPESPIDHEGYRAIEAALGVAFPEAAVVPFLFSASTDTKHYRDVTRAMYRLTPLKQNSAQLDGVHGRDERVEIGNLRRCEIFYKRLLETL
ncbi:MAG: M20/M25/M40 family metallo-hydrolase [Rectinemataceae bacterium]|jgi:carboxypeptidase PM20D1